jgi:hypothetical protein
VGSPQPRRARVVTTYLKIDSPTTLEKNLESAGRLLDRAGEEKPDVILLSELLPQRGLPDSEPIPGGPMMGLLAEKARAQRSYVITTLKEKAGTVLAETGQPFGIAAAEIDLNRSWRVRHLSVGPALGEPGSLYGKERRPETYGPLQVQ